MTDDPIRDADAYLPQVYEQLHALAEAFLRRERPDHTLQPTALVHEAYLRLADQDRARWNDASHFQATAATMIRRILVDHARGHKAAKRGGHWHRVTLSDRAEGGPDVDLLELEEALLELAALDERQARVVELRFFGGLGIKATGASLGVSPRTVDGDWRLARAWLHRRLGLSGEPEPS